LQMKGGASIMAATNFGWSVFIARMKLSTFWTKTYAAGVWVMNAATKAASIGMGLFNIAMTANPLLLIIGGVVALGAAIIKLTGNWDNVTNSVSLFFEKISKISSFSSFLSAIGIDFNLGESPKPIAAPASLKQSQSANIPQGGISKQISSVMNSSRSNSMGDVIMHNYGQAPNGQQFIDDLAMRAG